MRNGGLYIHIPFCHNKCLYCDFYSGGVRIADWENYVKCMLNELKIKKNGIYSDIDPSTLYIGGGTPSLMPMDYLSKLIQGIEKMYGHKDWKEFTIEINPEDITEEKCKGWKNLGVNRVSVGIQSLDDKELKRIGRRHDAESSIMALKLMRKYFSNVSVDVIYGLPTQTPASYLKTLEQLVALEPQHISVYSLTVEPGTALHVLDQQGKIEIPDEEEWIKLNRIAPDFLRSKGYLRYEISNYSLPGYEGRHNSSYWEGTPYIGLGPGAHSFNGYNVRESNYPDLKRYMKLLQTDVPTGYFQKEILNDEELREEMIMLSLRTSLGLDLLEFEKRFGIQKRNELDKKAEKLIKQELLQLNGNNLIVTEKGQNLLDLINRSLI
ncbi:MAG: radical SAM family heme chaperone HemW [Muribaculaceae bacterium]|nr:radical SAM family heme chaperone HemW [Muribaculaceae bacterium]